MDSGQKLLWKVGTALFAIIIAGSWIWSWIFPEDPNRYNVPTPAATQSESPGTGQVPIPYSNDPCDDEVTVQDYKSCIEDQYLDDWHDDREAEAGLP